MPLNRKRGVGGPDHRVRETHPFRVLAYDPGGTTGWAYAEWLPQEGEPLTNLEQILFLSGQIGPEEHHELLYEHLNSYAFGIEGPILELVCESFEFRQHITRDHAKTKVELISKEYIGIIKLFRQQYDRPVAFQTASAAKSFIPDKGPQSNVKLKQLGVYKPVTNEPHAMDAMRHLLRYMVFDKKIRSPITDAWL